MKIHFVCTGNTFRSRLAEAFLNSLQLKNIEVSSSGIKASMNLNGPICWYTEKILIENGINSFKSDNWRQTTSDLLAEQDLIIFMIDDNYNYCKKELGSKIDRFQIWHIPDIKGKVLLSKDHDKTLEEAEKEYQAIKQKVLVLAELLK